MALQFKPIFKTHTLRNNLPYSIITKGSGKMDKRIYIIGAGFAGGLIAILVIMAIVVALIMKANRNINKEYKR